MKTRILFVSHTAEWTGPTNSLVHLVRHLGERFEVEVLAPSEGALSEALAEQGIVEHVLPRLNRRRILAMRRLIRAGGYDLVYGNNTSGACRNALIAARLAGVRFACHVRGMAGPWEWGKFGFLRLADAVIAVSEACARSVERYARRGRLHVVHNGVDLSPADADLPSRPDSLPREVPSDARLLVSVAHLCPRKGQHHAVEAMARIARRLPSAHLLLVGALDRDPDYVERLRARVRGLGLEERVSVLGFREDVPALLRAAELFVHTAEADPHPRAVIEAMAAGLPVVAFGIDGVAETVESGVTGVLCLQGNVDALAAAAVDLMQDPERRLAFGKAGRRRVAERFSAEATARTVEQIIERVVAGGIRGIERPLPGDGSRAAGIRRVEIE